MTINTQETLDLFPTVPRSSWTEFAGGVRQERTGWRDQEISDRHRRWGADCPAVDLDFLLTEIHVGEPAALVEYKHFRARPVDSAAAVFLALRRLADRAEIPFLVAWYWPNSWAFRIRPLNDLAREHFEDPEDLSERAYVQRLYRLRRLTLARSLSESLSDVLPPVERRRP
ncbi:MAG: hypothetical protein ACLQO1_01620 [Steroidobacteraceae bacterium]